MKKRLKKKSERIRRNKIHRLLEIALDINGLSKRQEDYTGNLPTAFFYFSGHIASANVSIHKNGWFSYAEEDFYVEANTDNNQKLSSAIHRLEDYAVKEGIIV